MDIEARIRRRQHRDSEPRLVLDYESLSPVAHVPEPAGRGPVFERLLDYLDPVFNGGLPPNGYLYGPAGSGKSAVVTALITHLQRLPTETESAILTSTRAQTSSSPAFVYVDARTTTSEFAFYHDVLDSLVEETVPRQGVGTDTLRAKLREHLHGSQTGLVVAVDHVGESGSLEDDELVELFERLPGNVTWLAVGRDDPGELVLTDSTGATIEIEQYRRQMLVDVLMSRASTGLAQRALDHGKARRIAEWAAGNAHDALAALFGAADFAVTAGRSEITAEDLAAGMSDVPQPCVSLGRLLSLADNRQRVLRSLVDLDEDARESVDETTDAVVADPGVDLSAGTVKRFLYELAETGIIERVRIETASGGHGRPPSRVELRFPTRVFRRLYDLETTGE